MTNSTDQEREAFENKFKLPHGSRFSGGRYQYDDHELIDCIVHAEQWKAWKARAQQPVSVAVPVNPSRGELTTMLHAARKVYRLVDKAAVDYEVGRSALGYMEDIAASSSYLSSVLERLLAAAPHPVSGEPFQARVLPWLRECFGQAIADDQTERNHRFLEEALELVQSCGCTEDEAHKLVAYVYGRAVGERSQEVGGVMVTLAALCLSQRLDMHQCGETELARITQPAMVEKIREKQKRKPAMSPLPGSYGDREQFAAPPAAQDVIAPRDALANFIEYSVPGPYDCDEKWFADKKALVSALSAHRAQQAKP